MPELGKCIEQGLACSLMSRDEPHFTFLRRVSSVVYRPFKLEHIATLFCCNVHVCFCRVKQGCDPAGCLNPSRQLQASVMTQIHLHASSQTFACESCGHLNVISSSQAPLKEMKSQDLSRAAAHAEHELLEQVDLPTAQNTQKKPERTVSHAAGDTDDLDTLAAANAAKDGKLEQHIEELHLHQAHAHGSHHSASRRPSHLHPSGSLPRRSSTLSRSSSGAQDLAEDQQLPQQSGTPQPHPPTSHLTHPSQGAEPLQHSALGSGRSQGLSGLPGSRNNSGAMSGDEAGTVVLTLKGPTEVILAQIQRSTGSGHARNPSGSPLSKSSKQS